MSLLAVNRQPPINSRLWANIRHYAARDQEAPNAKVDNIRRALWPSNLRTRAAPTGGWRPDVAQALQFAIPSVQAHETIERAWKLHERHIRHQQDEETRRKFDCMRRAMEVLSEVDPHRYYEANKRDDPRARSPEEKVFMKNMRGNELRTAEARVRGLFPRELKAPADTPSRDGWNYEWKPFPRAL
ncbi:hypothetical protein DL96DRAFT_1575177 [Flagelloscypha sp. PMI_526]|nr:hypothetical protein DL96DRAFT_1575177 [Flagelloscypha sp. PMI_526]